ncbi:MAG: hypothetical protein HY369_03575 [Candidatus Aenigmarchaeota archaeon]|nr:hypothetical protein [Candidatus Aenigmarchaeota archaeon]
MADKWEEARRVLSERVRTRRVDFESYLDDLATLYRTAHRGAISTGEYAFRRRELEARYAGRVFPEDCRRFDSVEDYRRFMDLLAHISPTKSDELREALEHEIQHATPLQGQAGVRLWYGMWILREDDGTFSGYPCVATSADNDEIDLLARRRSIAAPHDLSPHDRAEMEGIDD